MTEGTEPMSTTEIARALAARRRRVESVCTTCGTPITGTGRRRYCSRTCEIRAYRARKRSGEAMPEAQAASEAQPAAVSPLVARLDATAAAIGRGRVFEDSTPAIRAAREEQ